MQDEGFAEEFSNQVRYSPPFSTQVRQTCDGWPLFSNRVR